MKKLYYPILLLAFIATNCFGTKKSTSSVKPNKLNPSKKKEIKSDPRKSKKENDISKKSSMSDTVLFSPNPENKKDVNNSKNVKNIQDVNGSKNVENIQDVNDSKNVENIQDINQVDSMGHTLLETAVRKNDTEQVKKLLKKGANPNIHEQHSDLLYSAVYHKNKEIVSLLLSHGAEVLFDKDGKSSVIREAAHEGDIGQEILDIILCHFADIGKKDSVGLTPIHWACRDGHLSVVKHILAKDRSVVNNTDNLYKFTPLHWASRRGFKEIVEILVSNGASKTAKSRSSFTPLMLAISNRHETLRSILSPDGFERQSKHKNKNWKCSICREGIYNVDNPDYNIAPIVSLDCTGTNNSNNHRFHVDCIAPSMVAQGENIQPITCPECRDNISENIIQALASNYVFGSPYSILKAVKKEDMTRLKTLLEKGGNPNESTTATSALQKAVNRHNYQMVCLLLEYGADPNYLNPSSLSTPLHEAVANMCFQRTSEDISNKICIALIQHGAFVNVRRLNGRSGEAPKDIYCTNKDPLFVIAEAGGIRSGWVNEIQPAFGLSGDKAKYKILLEDN
ncbi:ankyrin repeat domain-containing protein [Candidatus Cardinium hertigii]|uniref:ankyrin repeat domain-containing protein n=1 Tax=Candidatus Cardinium hertigii TaxID=247481 RepID=UPI003D7EA6E1